MRIALFFMAFLLGVGLAAGLDAADASSRHDRPGSQTVSVDVPATPENAGGEVQVQPVRWQGELPAAAAATHGTTSSGWTPGAGDLALAVVAVGTVGTGLLLRRRTPVPVRV